MAISPKEIQAIADALRSAAEHLERVQQYLLQNAPIPVGYNPARDILASLVVVGEILQGTRESYEKLIIPVATDDLQRTADGIELAPLTRERKTR